MSLIKELTLYFSITFTLVEVSKHQVILHLNGGRNYYHMSFLCVLQLVCFIVTCCSFQVDSNLGVLIVLTL